MEQSNFTAEVKENALKERIRNLELEVEYYKQDSRNIKMYVDESVLLKKQITCLNEELAKRELEVLRLKYQIKCINQETYIQSSETKDKDQK